LGYLGNKPTAVPIESSDLQDNIITSAKIVDGAITGDDINATFNIGSKTVTLPAASVTTHASDYIAWQSVVTAATLTAVAGRGYPINTTSNACTITLPASASVGDTIKFVDYARNWGTNALTINQNSLNFQGNTSPNPIYNTNAQAVTLTYVDATKGWLPTVDDDVTLETPQSYDAEYLVVAGGGCGGGTSVGAGGGAGGYRTNYGGTAISLTPSIVYTATIGAGGVGATPQGTDGGDSTLSGSDITDIVSTGGGAGGGNSTHGSAGGSGGGAGAPNFGGGGGTSIGAGNTPSTSPVQGYAGGIGHDGALIHTSSGGGGGASQVGGDADQTTSNGSWVRGGHGGNGTANAITGASVTYAGGGGGSVDYASGSVTTGGAGGGGIGYFGTGTPTAGTDGLGGGGGGGDSDSPAIYPNGGTGVIILRMATADYSGTTSGSPTITTDGSDTVIKFLTTGTYTA